MDTKLTLKLNSEAIEVARRFARRRGTSLSRMVEQYFNSLAPEVSGNETPSAVFDGTVVGRLLDAARAWPPREFTDAEIDSLRQTALEERYGSVSQQADT